MEPNMRLLHIDSSILGDASVSRTLTAAVVDKWQSREPGIEVIYRDLAAEPLSHLSGSHFAARALAPADRTPEQQREIDVSDAVLSEFLTADVIVLGAPMYNFSIPSQLKAWIDRIAVAGKTFRYTSSGPQGLAGGKKVIVVSSRGGVYAETPHDELDFQEAYLRAVFGFLGITDIEIVRAEGVSMGAAGKQQALAAAHRAIGLAA
jgi:FMN-dependent NADH-azoreductase